MSEHSVSPTPAPTRLSGPDLGGLDLGKKWAIMQGATLLAYQFIKSNLPVEPWLVPWLSILYLAPIMYLVYAAFSGAAYRTTVTVVMFSVWFLYSATTSIPLLVESKFPDSWLAAKLRTEDQDIRLADRIRPVGTGLRMTAAEHRILREQEITRWTETNLAQIRSELTAGIINVQIAEQREQEVIRQKYRDLAALQKVKLPDLPEAPSVTRESIVNWFKNFDATPVGWKLSGIALWGLVILVAVGGAWMSYSRWQPLPILIAFVVVVLALMFGRQLTAEGRLLAKAPTQPLLAQSHSTGAYAKPPLIYGPLKVINGVRFNPVNISCKSENGSPVTIEGETFVSSGKYREFRFPAPVICEFPGYQVKLGRGDAATILQQTPLITSTVSVDVVNAQQ